MNLHLRWTGVVALGGILILAMPALAVDPRDSTKLSMTTQGFSCRNHGFLHAIVYVVERSEELQVLCKIRSGLEPFEEVLCGFKCDEQPSVVTQKECEPATERDRRSCLVKFAPVPLCRGFMPVITLPEVRGPCTPSTSPAF